LALLNSVTEAPGEPFFPADGSSRWRAIRSHSVVRLKPKRFQVETMLVLIDGVYLNLGSVIFISLVSVCRLFPVVEDEPFLAASSL
jgi:hypothetical protein